MTDHDQDDEYSPDRIEYDLRHWQELCSSVEGGTGSTGSGAGRGDRLSLMCRKADLERAADTLPLHWQSTAWVFRRQNRQNALSQRRQTTRLSEQYLGDVQEDTRPLVALENVFWLMARSLGWVEKIGRVA